LPHRANKALFEQRLVELAQLQEVAHEVLLCVCMNEALSY
jgi:hypothetical protein